ncbi:GYD domain-containing protein [Thalassomonas sp. M1454]|uniref:GYD domain-containing protein n=1 Tax=Thalassomonas sp. M1454 TaxID=2594477 RepID=UPI00117C3064|nr:GYD domain-containing protein [Thalassomonas sp. M1454]TRX53435.1 GYD domain-containing protein [Thalassomonas sp. M1454]
MKILTYILTILIVSAGLMSTQVKADEPDLRHFMFIGEPNAKAWQMMVKDPTDRKQAVGAAFKALGGDIVSYYWGLGDGKNYITVTIPNDNELIQAIYLMRMPSGLLNSYQVIELMPSDQMSDALKRSAELLSNDTTVKK